MTWHIRHGTGYLLCFDVPFGHAKHYLGITIRPLPQRLRDHENGKGANLMNVVRKAGISWTLTRTWEDCDRNKERQLKNNPGTRYCPRCKEEKTRSEDPRYQNLMSQARADFAKSIAAANAEQEKAASKSAGTRQWNKAVQTAQNQLRAAREQAAQTWADAHPGQARTRALGRQGDAGMPADRVGQVQQDISAHLLNEARAPEGRAFASECDWAAETLVHELRERERRPGPELEAAG
jgi:uncharacterized Zn finger protein (UPF0148 family)